MRPIRYIEHPNTKPTLTPFVGDQVKICEAFGFDIPDGCAPEYVVRKTNKGKRGRWREMLYAYLSGLVVIDVDHCGNPREVFVRIQQEHDLKAEGILLVYVSARGEGLKIVFRARPAEQWGNLICQQYEMASLLGILDYVDDACKDSNRLSWITGPDDVLYCDTKELFNVEPQNE